MPLFTIIIGSLLGLVGIVGFVVTDMRHLTALIPFAIGDVLAGCGVLSLARPHWRKHAMHVAVSIALVGFVGTVSSGVKISGWVNGNTPERPEAVMAQGATAFLCLIFIIVAVRSFVVARKARAASQAKAT